MTGIQVSIVLYNNSPEEIKDLLHSLATAAVVDRVHIIDNSPLNTLESQVKLHEKITYTHSPQNLGYGSAHNIGIKHSIESGSKYHIICNPDIAIPEGTLQGLYDFMEANKDIGLTMPKVLYTSGEIQYLCKLLPTPFDLIVRRFLFGPLKKLFRKRLDRYEMKDRNYLQMMDVPNLSGCFMFHRTAVLQKVGGFDERYFMYLEDTDLCRRVGQVSRTVYYPDVFVYHGYAKESYKSVNLLVHHVISALKYFNKWGWLFDNDRSRINNQYK